MSLRRKIGAAALAALGLTAAALVFLLGTTAGLRWSVDQALSRSGAAVEIGAVDGRLLGPATLTGVSYRDPDSGLRVRVDAIDLDWRPTALLRGLLHLTRLQASGVEIAPGKSAGPSRAGDTTLPEVSLPLAVRVDELGLDGLATVDESGVSATVLERASLRASVDAEAALLTDIAVEAGELAIDGGRIRLSLAGGMPLEAALQWRATPPDGPVFSGGFTLSGSIGGTLTPVLDVKAPFAARGEGTVDNLLDTPHWTFRAATGEPVALDRIVSSLPAVSLEGEIRAEGDAASSTRVTPELSLSRGDARMAFTGEIDVSPQTVVIRHARLSRAGGPDTVDVTGRVELGGARPFQLQADWQSIRGPAGTSWASESGALRAEGDMKQATATVSGTVTPPGEEAASPFNVAVTARGLDDQPGITAEVRVPRFTYAGLDASDVSVDLDYRAADEPASDIAFKASRLRVAGREATDIELRANGMPARHEVTLTGTLDGWALQTALTGAYEDDRWDARMTRLTAGSPEGSGFGEWTLARPANLAWSPARSELDEICLQSGNAQLCANGRFAGPADWQAGAGLTGLPLALLTRDTPEALRVDGRLEANAEIGDRGEGITGEARAAVDHATVAWEGEDPVTTEYRDVVATASLTPGELRATLDGRVDESGSIRGELVAGDPLADDGALQGNLSVELPSLRVIQAAAPALGLRDGAASLALRIDGTRAAPRLSGDGHITDAVLDVTPLGIRLTALDLDFNSDDGRRVNIEARAESGDGSVSADGHLERPDDGGPWPFELRGEWQSLRGPESATWTSRSGEIEARGDTRSLTASASGTVAAPGQAEESSISVDVEARGLDAQPEIAGSIRLPYFTWGDITGRDIRADIDAHAAEGKASDVLVKAARLRAAGRDAADIELRLKGTPAEHEAALSGKLDGWAIDAGVTGSYGKERWSGRLERLTAAPPADAGFDRWAMAQPADLVWSPARSEVKEICLRSAGTEFCADGFFAGPADWQAGAALTGLPLRLLTRDAPEALRVDGELSANLEIGNRGKGLSGEAGANIDRATVAWEAEDPVTTAYRDVALSATLAPAELRATLEGRVDESGTIQGELVTADPLADDGTLRGTLSAELPSLRVIQAAAPALGLQRGTARLDLRVAGTRAAPRLSGTGRIADAVLDVAPLGARLSALSLEIAGSDSRRLDIEARADAGAGTLSADGFVAWPENGGWESEVQVRGEKAELVRTPKALIDGSPDLRITADETGGTVTGRVRIDRAELTPEAGRPQVTISEDIVVKGADTGGKPARNPMAWHAKVTIELGDDTRFRGYGMKARLSGALDIDAPPRQPTRANGAIEIHDGEYSLYGRTLNIGRGRLVYTGGPVDNPGIDVEVVKEVRDVSVTMAISGPLVDPNLSLTSTPAMSETDKMSYLLLGRPAAEASGAEAGLLLKAAASLIPGGGAGGVPRRIQSTLGLDTLEVRADSDETEGAAVELGKYLAPDLYVSYIAGFQQGVDIFRVRYELARHWLLQAESTTRGSGGDLLFTW